MSTTSPAALSAPTSSRFERYIKPWLTPYYFTLAAVAGIVTVIFTVVSILLLLVALNFNVLGWIE